MVRVSGGVLRGRVLAALPDERVRPTTGRMRETIFSLLGPRIVDLWVLDLFAGSGILGIEALSRGARAAVFVERDPQIAALLERNLASLRLEARARVCVDSVVRPGVAAQLRQETRTLFDDWRTFDLIFMDPPYHAGLLAPTLAMLAGSALLAPEAMVVAEHETTSVAKGVAPGWRPMHNRRQGESQVSFWQWRGEATKTGRL
ncbi:MAG: 16S rRNA (guanine(966)-N(2))-methyltransferase RsmD [Magnetococcus sp. YQC-9]